jgi:EAL domain-containing protein (putative c-di-GMP-specific phosphodiesterase class I)
LSWLDGKLVGLKPWCAGNIPVGGIFPPRLFPLAEETGLILGIGDWTQHMACQQLQQWREQYPQAADLPLA